jgi:hypothetical protein
LFFSVFHYLTGCTYFLPYHILSQGTLSFFSYGASGIFGYASKVAAAAGQAIASISLDSEFRDWHNDKVVVAATNLNREWKRRGVQNISQILTRPLIDIMLGTVGGISGIVISPAKGFQRNGTQGLLIGTAAGLVGVFAKPTVGSQFLPLTYAPFGIISHSFPRPPPPLSSGGCVRCCDTFFRLYS